MDTSVGIYASSLSRRDHVLRRLRRRRMAIAARVMAGTTIVAGAAVAVALAERLTG